MLSTWICSVNWQARVSHWMPLENSGSETVCYTWHPALQGVECIPIKVSGNWICSITCRSCQLSCIIGSFNFLEFMALGIENNFSVYLDDQNVPLWKPSLDFHVTGAGQAWTSCASGVTEEAQAAFQFPAPYDPKLSLLPLKGKKIQAIFRELSSKQAVSAIAIIFWTGLNYQLDFLGSPKLKTMPSLEFSWQQSCIAVAESYMF